MNDMGERKNIIFSPFSIIHLSIFFLLAYFFSPLIFFISFFHFSSIFFFLANSLFKKKRASELPLSLSFWIHGRLPVTKGLCFDPVCVFVSPLFIHDSRQQCRNKSEQDILAAQHLAAFGNASSSTS